MMLEGAVAVEGKIESSICFDRYELDAETYELRRAGQTISLPPQPLKILALLAAYPNELVTRQQIREALWPGELHGDFDSRLNFAVNKLRETLGDSAEHPRYIQTVRNAGYRFIAPVRSGAEISSIGGDGQPKPELVSTAGDSGSARGFHLRWRVFLAAVVAVVAVVLTFGVLLAWRGGANPSAHWEGNTPTGLVSVDGVPQISAVSPVFPVARQRIVIRGRGFGLHVPYSHTDSPFLAIGDITRDWAAGRMVPHNWDEVMLDVESWTDREIVISGFSGDYGKSGWVLAPGDQLEVRVWNPESGLGPAEFSVVVSSEK